MDGIYGGPGTIIRQEVAPFPLANVPGLNIEERRKQLAISLSSERVKIFEKPNKLTPGARQACEALGIAPANLFQKPLTSFGGRGEADRIKEMRRKYYEAKRKQYLKEVESLLRQKASQLTTQTLDTKEMIYKQDRLVGLGPVAPSTSDLKSPRLISERSVQKLNRSYSPSAMLKREPSIPLRSPLSKQETLQKQLARSLFEKERKERVVLNKEREEKKQKEALQRWEAKYVKPLAQDPMKDEREENIKKLHKVQSEALERVRKKEKEEARRWIQRHNKLQKSLERFFDSRQKKETISSGKGSPQES